eukprot:gene4061-2911_t
MKSFRLINSLGILSPSRTVGWSSFLGEKRSVAGGAPFLFCRRYLSDERKGPLSSTAGPLDTKSDAESGMVDPSLYFFDGLSSAEENTPHHGTPSVSPEGRLMPSMDTDAQDVEDALYSPNDLHPEPSSAPPRSVPQAWDWDDDEQSVPPPSDLTVAVATTPVEVRELLDDNFSYLPQANHFLQTEPAAEYIPGQPLVPPGFTRYRVDVQYQGSDFQGWYRSTSRYRIKERKTADGGIERIAVETSSDSRVLDEGMQTVHFAKTILEEALGVAVDISHPIQVIASVIPESGVSVRRLPCHVDLPSEIEMPPRTILKRATMWLQQRNQPLAILCCHPCRNPRFHARHSGVRRVYCYRLLNRIAPPLFDAGFQWHVDRHLDTSRMQRFAKEMEGTRDFGYFTDPKMANALRRAAVSVPGRLTSSYAPEHEPLTVQGLGQKERLLAPKAVTIRGLTQLERAKALPTFNEYGQTVKTYQAKPREFAKPRTNLPTVRTIDKIDVVRQDDEVVIWFVARSFLRHQIRNMVSVLKAAGHGLWDEQELRHAFRSGFEPSRKKFERERLPPAPVHGLTLWEVDFPPEHKEDYVPYVDAGVLEEGVELTTANNNNNSK